MLDIIFYTFLGIGVVCTIVWLIALIFEFILYLIIIIGGHGNE